MPSTVRQKTLVATRGPESSSRTRRELQPASSRLSAMMRGCMLSPPAVRCEESIFGSPLWFYLTTPPPSLVVGAPGLRADFAEEAGYPPRLLHPIQSTDGLQSGADVAGPAGH